MRSASAGEFPAETVSVPLRGRRQLHLQQRELLNASGGQAEKPREKDGKAAVKVKERDGPLRSDKCGHFWISRTSSRTSSHHRCFANNNKKKAIVAQKSEGITHTVVSTSACSAFCHFNKRNCADFKTFLPILFLFAGHGDHFL